MSNEKIAITKTTNRKQKPNFEHLEFGKEFTDHMFVMDYSINKGWHDARIIPYQPLSIDPSAMIFHYGQTVFEGLKAYYTEEGKVLLFRPDKNMQRLNQSNDRLCIPEIDENLALEALQELIKIDHEWVPKKKVLPYIFVHSLLLLSRHSECTLQNSISLLLSCHLLVLTIKKGFNQSKLLLKVVMFVPLQVEQVKQKQLVTMLLV